MLHQQEARLAGRGGARRARTAVARRAGVDRAAPSATRVWASTSSRVRASPTTSRGRAHGRAGPPRRPGRRPVGAGSARGRPRRWWPPPGRSGRRPSWVTRGGEEVADDGEPRGRRRRPGAPAASGRSTARAPRATSRCAARATSPPTGPWAARHASAPAQLRRARRARRRAPRRRRASRGRGRRTRRAAPASRRRRRHARHSSPASAQTASTTSTIRSHVRHSGRTSTVTRTGSDGAADPLAPPRSRSRTTRRSLAEPSDDRRRRRPGPLTAGHGPLDEPRAGGWRTGDEGLGAARMLRSQRGHGPVSAGRTTAGSEWSSSEGERLVRCRRRRRADRVRPGRAPRQRWPSTAAPRWSAVTARDGATPPDPGPGRRLRVRPHRRRDRHAAPAARRPRPGAASRGRTWPQRPPEQGYAAYPEQRGRDARGPGGPVAHPMDHPSHPGLPRVTGHPVPPAGPRPVGPAGPGPRPAAPPRRRAAPAAPSPPGGRADGPRPRDRPAAPPRRRRCRPRRRRPSTVPPVVEVDPADLADAGLEEAEESVADGWALRPGHPGRRRRGLRHAVRPLPRRRVPLRLLPARRPRRRRGPRPRRRSSGPSAGSRSVSYQGRDIGAWFVTIARNLVLDHVKSSRYRLEQATPEITDVARRPRAAPARRAR